MNPPPPRILISSCPRSLLLLIVPGMGADGAPANRTRRLQEEMRSSLSRWMTERANERKWGMWGGRNLGQALTAGWGVGGEVSWRGLKTEKAADEGRMLKPTEEDEEARSVCEDLIYLNQRPQSSLVTSQHNQDFYKTSVFLKYGRFYWPSKILERFSIIVVFILKHHNCQNMKLICFFGFNRTWLNIDPSV